MYAVRGPSRHDDALAASHGHHDRLSTLAQEVTTATPPILLSFEICRGFTNQLLALYNGLAIVRDLNVTVLLPDFHSGYLHPADCALGADCNVRSPLCSNSHSVPRTNRILALHQPIQSLRQHRTCCPWRPFSTCPASPSVSASGGSSSCQLLDQAFVKGVDSSCMDRKHSCPALMRSSGDAKSCTHCRHDLSVLFAVRSQGCMSSAPNHERHQYG